MIHRPRCSQSSENLVDVRTFALRIHYNEISSLRSSASLTLSTPPARTAGRLLYENGFAFDTCHTSLLKRASFTANMALNTANQHFVNVQKSFKLNERHYGRLQGYNKDEGEIFLGLGSDIERRHETLLYHTLPYLLTHAPPLRPAYHELNIDRELLMRMRRTWNTAPPKMEDEHPYWHGKVRK